MPRKKKEDVVDVSKELEKKLKEKPVDFGSGMTRLNNELMAREEKRNE